VLGRGLKEEHKGDLNDTKIKFIIVQNLYAGQRRLGCLARNSAYIRRDSGGGVATRAA
jgi:hypothetical protein